MDTEHEFTAGSGGTVTLIQAADCHGFGVREEADCVVVTVAGAEHRLMPGEAWRIDRAGIAAVPDDPEKKPKKPKKPKDKEKSDD